MVGERRYLIPASFFAAIHQGCEAAVPLVIGLIVDHAISPGSTRGLIVTLLLLVALFAVLTTAMRLGGRLVRHATQGAAHELRVRLTRRVLNPGGFAQSGARSGTLLSTATSDAGRVGMVNAAVWTSAGALGALVVAAIVLLRASLVLGLVVLLGLIPVVALTRLISKPLVRRSSAEQAAAAHAAGVAVDLVEGLRVIKGLGAELTVLRRYAGASKQARTAAVHAARTIALRSGVIVLLTGVFLAVVALVGGRLASAGSITVGEFVTAFTLTQFLVGPFTRIVMVGTQFSRARASAARIAAVLDEELTVRGDKAATGTLDAGVPAVSLRAVHGPGLSGVGLDVRAGEFLGVVVEDLASAETLVRWLGREVDPEAGLLLLGGVPMSELDPETVRSVVLVAAHEGVLFRGTVAENVSARGTAETVARALEAVGVGEMLPDGADTEITERGRSLSGGQRQRVLLARALAAEPPVLVLHEPTTAVDAVTEAALAESLRRVRAGRTTVVLASSPALLAGADRVVVLRDGVVAASGAHGELLADDEQYRELVAR